jgi:hypothetical protein
MRRIRSGCCARTKSGDATSAASAINSRRLIAFVRNAMVEAARISGLRTLC